MLGPPFPSLYPQQDHLPNPLICLLWVSLLRWTLCSLRGVVLSPQHSPDTREAVSAKRGGDRRSGSRLRAWQGKGHPHIGKPSRLPRKQVGAWGWG